MQVERVEKVLERLGYKLVSDKDTMKIWLGGRSPLRIVVPLRFPHAMIARTNPSLVVWDPDGALQRGERYTVWDRIGTRHKGEIFLGQDGKAILVTGSASRWDLVGPPSWWSSALASLEKLISRLDPYAVVQRPIYASASWSGGLGRGGALWLVPAPRCDWRPLAAPWARPVCPDSYRVGE